MTSEGLNQIAEARPGTSGSCSTPATLDDLLRQRFANFRAVYLPTAARLAGYGFELLPTGQRPHFTVRLRHTDDPELDRLLAALGDLRPNPQYAKGRI